MFLTKLAVVLIVTASTVGSVVLIPPALVLDKAGQGVVHVLKVIKDKLID